MLKVIFIGEERGSKEDIVVEIYKWGVNVLYYSYIRKNGEEKIMI